MDKNRPQDWQELCKAAATELDPVKLMDRISEIIAALDARDKKMNAVRTSGPDDDTAELSCGKFSGINEVA